MIDELHALAEATCKHCGQPITQYRGDWSGVDWYHTSSEENGWYGGKPCRGAPMAWPIDDTIRDAPPVVSVGVNPAEEENQ